MAAAGRRGWLSGRLDTAQSRAQAINAVSPALSMRAWLIDVAESAVRSVGSDGSSDGTAVAVWIRDARISEDTTFRLQVRAGFATAMAAVWHGIVECGSQPHRTQQDLSFNQQLRRCPQSGLRTITQIITPYSCTRDTRCQVRSLAVAWRRTARVGVQLL